MTIRRISPQKLAKLGGKVPYSTIVKRGAPRKSNPKREMLAAFFIYKEGTVER